MLVLGWNYRVVNSNSATMVFTLRKNSAFAEVNIDNEGSLLMVLMLCLLSEVGVRSVDSSHSNVYFNILR